MAGYFTGCMLRVLRGGQCGGRRRQGRASTNLLPAWVLRGLLQIFKEAQDLLPGGVNSPVRAFKSVGGQPIVFDHVKVDLPAVPLLPHEPATQRSPWVPLGLA
jgi:hypothetical protein